MTKEGKVEVMPARHGPHKFKDELNFAEFPIAAVSDTVPENQKTLEFTDEIFDPSSGKNVTRTVTITAADKFGLPTALDDEVLLGFFQLSIEQGLVDPKVHFSRYEVIKLLGWRDESKSYRRIEDSLNRWAGVLLQYRKAWWSKEEQCWVNETFHVIDKFTLFDRERIARRRMMAKEAPDKALSSFTWNETVFQSFKAGYIKSLDFDFYKSLKSAISKRMFRFLDKRFYHKARWEFDLQTFACEHIGLSKNYSNSELKRKLLTAIRELEERGYLAILPMSDRFVQVRQGHWKAVFVKAKSKLEVLPQEGDASLVNDLISRGITPRSATKLVTNNERSRIEANLLLFDKTRAEGGEGAIRRRGGWLYSAIVNDYAGRESHLTSRRESPTSTQSSQPRFSAPAATSVETNSPEQVAFEAMWAGLSIPERESFESEAIAAAPAFLQRQYHDGKAVQGTLWRVTREKILMIHFARSSRDAVSS